MVSLGDIQQLIEEDNKLLQPTNLGDGGIEGDDCGRNVRETKMVVRMLHDCMSLQCLSV